MPRTLIQIFLDAVDVHRKSAQFMRRANGAWQSVSGAAALETVESLALGLETLGIGRGDRVAILCETRLEWSLVDLAALGLGAVTVPIYPTLTADQAAALLRDSEAKLIVVSNATQRDKIRSVRAGLPALEALIEIDRQEGVASPRGEHGLGDVIRVGAARRAQDPGAFRTRAATVRPEDLATIIYTSGTTGEPKGAMLSHANIAFDIESCLQVMPLSRDDTCLSFLPLSHVFERMAGLYSMLAAGVTIAYAEGLDTVASNALEVRPTVLIAMPRFYEKVLTRVNDSVSKRPRYAQRLFRWGIAQGTRAARAHFERRRLGPLAALKAALADRLVAHAIRARVGGRLRFGISGGAPLSPRTLEFFFAIGIPIREGYGLTETSPVVCLNRPGREKPGSVGPAIPGVEVKIGDAGEILTHGPHVMMGYFRNPEATRAAITDGWFHTGDIGHLDPDGSLVITDRLKDLIVTAGGKKVAPQPIEAKLRDSRWIGDAVLIGDRRPYVVALLVPDFPQLEVEAAARGWPAADRRALLARPEVRELYAAEIARANADRAPFEQIKTFGLLERELTQEAGELTPSLKVKRRVINEKYAGVIEALYGAASKVETAA